MSFDGSASNSSPLLALGDVPPRDSIVERPEIDALDDWLRSPRTDGLLWVYGPIGSGRTTAVSAALKSGPERSIPVKRVSCGHGAPLEEILEDVNDFLAQLGNATLAKAVGQRSFLRAKIAVLFRALRECPFLLWLDDFDTLESADRSILQASEPLDYFLEGCRTLRGSLGRVLIVAKRPPPSDDVARISIGSLSAQTARDLWLRSRAPEPEAELPRNAFEVQFLARIATHVSPREAQNILAGAADPVEAGVEAALTRLDARAVELAEALAILPPRLSRQALRELAAPEGVELELQAPLADPLLGELEDWGLVDILHGEDGESPLVSVPARIRESLSRRVLRASEARWQEYHRKAGSYFLRTASRTSSLWHFVTSWREYYAAGHYDEAYELQKGFLQEIIQRGYLELARGILETTVQTAEGLAKAVTLGNLAITYKNAGDHERAMAAYEQVHSEFRALGDLPNVARVLHQLGNVHYVRGEYDAALASYRDSLEISRELGEREVAVATRIQIANIHYQRRELDNALAEYLRTIEETRDLGAQGLTAAVALQISQVYLQTGRYLEAESALREAESAARAADDLRNLFKVFQAQGILARKRREYDQARERFEQAFATAETIGDAVEAAASLVLIGDLEMTRLQLAEALKLYLQARDRLESYRARASATPKELREIATRIGERINSLAESVGPEAFQRVLQRARTEGTDAA